VARRSTSRLVTILVCQSTLRSVPVTSSGSIKTTRVSGSSAVTVHRHDDPHLGTGPADDVGELEDPVLLTQPA
jgi:hypothetical protein